MRCDMSPVGGDEAAAAEAWRPFWLLPLTAALSADDDALRSNASVYALRELLAIDPGTLPPLLAHLSTLDSPNAVSAGGALADLGTAPAWPSLWPGLSFPLPCLWRLWHGVGGATRRQPLPRRPCAAPAAQAAACVAAMRAARQERLVTNLEDLGALGMGEEAVECTLQASVNHHCESVRCECPSANPRRRRRWRLWKLWRWHMPPVLLVPRSANDAPCCGCTCCCRCRTMPLPLTPSLTTLPLRMDAMHLVFAHPRLSTPPTAQELRVASQASSAAARPPLCTLCLTCSWWSSCCAAVPLEVLTLRCAVPRPPVQVVVLTLRCTLPSLRNKALPLLGQLLARIRSSAGAALLGGPHRTTGTPPLPPHGACILREPGQTLCEAGLCAPSRRQGSLPLCEASLPARAASTCCLHRLPAGRRGAGRGRRAPVRVDAVAHAAPGGRHLPGGAL
jgi:hypothetical protein